MSFTKERFLVSHASSCTVDRLSVLNYLLAGCCVKELILLAENGCFIVWMPCEINFIGSPIQPMRSGFWTPCVSDRNIVATETVKG